MTKTLAICSYMTLEYANRFERESEQSIIVILMRAFSSFSRGLLCGNYF